MAEEGANALWSLGQAAHVVDDSLLELPLAAGERPGGDGLLEIAVQALVGVEVRAIGWEVGNLDLALPSRADMEVVWPAPYLRAVSREGGPRLCRWDPSVRRPEATARHALLCGGLVRLAEDR